MSRLVYVLNGPNLNLLGKRQPHIYGHETLADVERDCRKLAEELKLETGYDTDGKFMAGRELVSRDVVDAKTGEPMIESVILSVSNVKSHPGKTLAGCTYSLDIPAEGEAPAAAPAPAKTTPPA